MVFSHATTHKYKIMDEIDDLKSASKQSHWKCSLEYKVTNGGKNLTNGNTIGPRENEGDIVKVCWFRKKYHIDSYLYGWRNNQNIFLGFLNWVLNLQFCNKKTVTRYCLVFKCKYKGGPLLTCNCFPGTSQRYAWR